jgi:hypothetical protein
MNKKIISLFTLLAFIVFSLSCYTWKKKEIRTVADWKGKKGKILWVIKTSGEYVEFSKDNPGRIYGDEIAGTAVGLSKEVEITRDNVIKLKRYRNGVISEITHKNGKIYPAVAGTIRFVSTKDMLTGKEAEKIIFFTIYETSKSVVIPLSEVKSIQVESGDSIASILVLLGAVILFSYIQSAKLPMGDGWD